MNGPGLSPHRRRPCFHFHKHLPQAWEHSNLYRIPSVPKKPIPGDRFPISMVERNKSSGSIPRHRFSSPVLLMEILIFRDSDGTPAFPADSRRLQPTLGPPFLALLVSVSGLTDGNIDFPGS